MLLKLDYLCRKNRTMFLKILILDVHRQKNFGNLKGSTPKEQYDYYEKKYLNNATYVKSLLQEYPELKRLLELKNNSIQRAECEIRKSLYAEKEQIQKIFCDGRKFSGTVGIYMSKGDTHRGGRSVAKVELDNGTILYYKPHSLDKNIKYQELYNYLCRKTGISCRTVQYLSHDSYGWEEKIENIPCKNESEVEHYYFRMGIHLFLGYALGATDLHGENIIAHGEYPVIIDMETYPGYLKQQSEKDGSSVEEKINKSTEIKLANSVIHTGMLPVLTWGRGNRGVLISAMGTEEKIKTPFKLPVVKDDKTSDIHIEYEPVEMQIKECIVRLNDQVINAADYTECIIRGFCRAYMVTMADKKVEVMLSGFFDGRSRVVLRHTQQYAMYLMASFHPDYMKSRECRKALLNVIHKEGESSFMKEIHDYEIDSLLEMDIPCFEIDANSRSVYDGNGGEHKEYLPCTPYESWRMHMKQMSYSDMECQCDYIRLSMEMLKASDGKKKMFPTRIKGYDTDKERKIYSQIRKIVHRICSRAIIREQSVGWTGLQFWDNGHWNLRSGGIYLYDGISGTVLFLAKYLHDFEEKNASAEEIYHLAVLRLKAYTDEIHKKQIYDKNLLTGIVNGESSVVYTYLYLFKLTGKRVWMIYAEKHFSIIERVWKEDSQLDYLSGNAGAIVVAVMLYKETGNLKYYEIAADMEKDLWKKGQETGNGYGWRLKGTDGPLAGMSHGNSGFMMAYAALYECNHKAEYADKIQLLLKYEDSLYSEKAGNWKDLRESSGESFMNAWCHGAPGILLSRMKLEELFPEDMQIKKDRLNAADSLFYGEQDEKICLCHGMSGNLLIMKKYLRKYGNKKMKKQYEALCDCLLFQLDHPAKISGTEYLNLAFMNGISGTGMALMEIL